MPLTIPSSLRLTSRVGRIAAQAAVVTAVVGGTVAYAHADKTVTLSVDGKTSEVSSFAGTVGELLEQEGVSTSSRDLVAPAVSSDLDEGDSVVVRFARPFTVTVDGAERTYWTTETTVDGALAAMGLRADGARLSASRSQAIGRQGLDVTMFTPKRVNIADGAAAPRAVTTTAATVADLLAELKLTVRPSDKLSLPASTPVTAGLGVTLTRVDVKQGSTTEKVRHETRRTNSDDLYEGTTKVVTAGKDGLRKVTYSLTYVNGKETARKAVASTVVTAPVTEVVAVGTKAKPKATTTRSSSSSSSSSRSSSYSGPSSTGGSADSLNWAALARCESGGNPRAVNPSGSYFGLYQFSVSTWRSVGGSGLPSEASSSEQTYRAKLLYERAGAGQWPHCGPRLFS